MSFDPRRTPTLVPPSVRIARLAGSSDTAARARDGRTSTDTYVPVLLVTREAAMKHVVDFSARFLLGFVDGGTPVYELLEATGMPLEEAVSALLLLYEQGIVGLAPPPDRGGEARVS